jgi:hypothetical protein
VDVNGDGKLDILSGSYSRHDPDMAGLFQVLYGDAEGTFRPAEVLNGSDGKPLILQFRAGQSGVTDKICTRPFAVDLNGDGKLDIVSGNFTGTFGLFLGEGDGKFAPTSTWLEADGKPMRVSAHSDPFLVDWDGDGDLDLLSGASDGGAYLFVNEGSRTEPKFGAKQTLVPAHRGTRGASTFGDAHITGPQGSTRVWADDVDGDGKLDLLLGDSVSLTHLADGVDEETARKGMAACDEKQKEISAPLQVVNGEQPSREAMKAFQAAYEELAKERAKFVREERTGFVWLLRQK